MPYTLGIEVIMFAEDVEVSMRITNGCDNSLLQIAVDDEYNWMVCEVAVLIAVDKRCILNIGQKPIS